MGLSRETPGWGTRHWHFLCYCHRLKQSVATQEQLIGRRQGSGSKVAHLLFYTNLSCVLGEQPTPILSIQSSASVKEDDWVSLFFSTTYKAFHGSEIPHGHLFSVLRLDSSLMGNLTLSLPIWETSILITNAFRAPDTQ